MDAIYYEGVTLTYSWGVSIVYPIIASYRAFDGYSSLASRSAALSLQFGGVTIPVGTMLKKMTTETPVEEDELSTRLMAVQMWMIYWIVNGCVGIVESVLFLANFPLYSILRFCFSVWLISPIVLTNILSRELAAMLEAQIKSKWVEFFSLGCGLVFSRVLKPFMDDKLECLKMVNADQILNGIWQSLVLPVTSVISNTRNKSGETSGPWTISGLVSSAVSNPLSFFMLLGLEKGETGTQNVSKASSDLDEYDMIDSPTSAGENGAPEGLTQRQATKDSSSRFWLW